MRVDCSIFTENGLAVNFLLYVKIKLLKAKSYAKLRLLGLDEVVVHLGSFAVQYIRFRCPIAFSVRGPVSYISLASSAELHPNRCVGKLWCIYRNSFESFGSYPPIISLCPVLYFFLFLKPMSSSSSFFIKIFLQTLLSLSLSSFLLKFSKPTL